MKAGRYIITIDPKSFDKLTIIKASQAISGILDMKELLEKIIKILMEYSGAQRCVIIGSEDGILNILAQGSAGDGKIEIYKSRLLENLPLSLINYTLKTSETLISGEAKSEEIFNNDPYFKYKKKGSILCLPLIGKSKLTYVLYLENEALSGVFNPNGLEIINILSAQASISLEASRTFREIQGYKKIVSTSAEHLSIIDKSYRYKVVNEAYIKAHDKNIEDIIGHPVSKFLGQEDFEQIIRARIDRCLLGETINYQSWFNYKGLGRKYMDVYYYPIYEKDGSINQIVVNARDITKLKDNEDELRRYSSRILSAQDEERKRIAMELHDGLAQSLLLAKMKAQTKGIDKDIISDISSIIGELRNITMNLRPAFLEQVNFINVLIWYSKQFEAKTKIAFKINAPEEVDITPLIKEHLFRIYQEALNNILKHSGADKIEIGLNKENGSIIMTIKDNGRGIKGDAEIKDNPKPRSGLGLFTMKERTEYINGTLGIESNVHGTRITVCVPMS